MSAQISYLPRRRRRPVPPILPIESPIAINTTAPEERPIVPLLEPPTKAPEPLRQWSAMDEIGRLGEVVKNRQAAPIEDVPRWKAALMGALASLGHVNSRPLAPGESAAARILGAAAGGGITGAAVPAIEGQRRKDVHVAQAEEEYQRAIENQKKVVGIETDQVMNRRREAEIPWLEARPGIEERKVESIDTHRDESRDIKRQANESINDYRNRTLGQRQAANESTEAYRQRMVELRERGLTERERHNRVTEDLGAGNLGVRQESNRIRSEAPAAGSVPARRDGAAAQRLLNSARTLRTRAANPNLDPAAQAALHEQADALEADVQNQYPDVVEQEVAAPAPGLMGRAGTPKPNLRMRGKAPAGVKLSEAEILSKFPNNPAKAAAAIKRARSRGLL